MTALVYYADALVLVAAVAGFGLALLAGLLVVVALRP